MTQPSKPLTERSSTWIRRNGLAIAALSLAASSLLAVGCGGGDDNGDSASSETEGTFVGKVEGTDGYIALVSDGEQVDGFLCDGVSGIEVEDAETVWIGPSDISDGSAELVARKDNAQLGEVTFSGGEASGEVRFADASHPFTAEAATGEAGLYRGVQDEGSPEQVEGGWIVLADGTQRGAVAGPTNPVSNRPDWWSYRTINTSAPAFQSQAQNVTLQVNRVSRPGG